MRMTEDYWDYNKRDILQARTQEDLAEGNFEVVSPVEAEVGGFIGDITFGTRAS